MTAKEVREMVTEETWDVLCMIALDEFGLSRETLAWDSGLGMIFVNAALTALMQLGVIEGRVELGETVYVTTIEVWE